MVKTSFAGLICLLSACTTSRGIIQKALDQGEILYITVEKYEADKYPSSEYNVSIAEISENVFELHMEAPEVEEVYYIPIEKLPLLLEMEHSFKDLESKHAPPYYQVSVETDHSKRKYHINTDLIMDFITALED